MQPRELMLAHGAQVLSDVQLLEVLIGAGGRGHSKTVIAEALPGTFPRLKDMGSASLEELMAISGIGLSKASLLAASIELGQRVQQRQSLRFGQILGAEALGQEMMARLAGAKEEYLLVIFLDVKNAIIQELELSHGGVDKSVADPRVVFRLALRMNASKLILVHNHPSGDSHPSAMDIDLTQRFAAAGALIGIAVVDHLIVGAQNFYSFSMEHQL